MWDWLRDLFPIRKSGPGAQQIQNRLEVGRYIAPTRSVPGCITSVHSGGIPFGSLPRQDLITNIWEIKTRTDSVPATQICPRGLGVIHSVIPVEQKKRTHWVGCTVPGDPEMNVSVGACLFKTSAFKTSSDEKTHGRNSGFDCLDRIHRSQ